MDYVLLDVTRMCLHLGNDLGLGQDIVENVWKKTSSTAMYSVTVRRLISLSRQTLLVLFGIEIVTTVNYLNEVLLTVVLPLIQEFVENCLRSHPLAWSVPVE